MLCFAETTSMSTSVMLWFSVQLYSYSAIQLYSYSIIYLLYYAFDNATPLRRPYNTNRSGTRLLQPTYISQNPSKSAHSYRCKAAVGLTHPNYHDVSQQCLDCIPQLHALTWTPCFSHQPYILHFPPSISLTHLYHISYTVCLLISMCLKAIGWCRMCPKQHPIPYIVHYF